MMKIALSIAISLWAFQASACDTKEYSQYKDRTKTKAGRQGLAQDYCLNSELARINGAPGLPASFQQKRDKCRGELHKILDALATVKANALIEYAGNGCKGPMP